MRPSRWLLLTSGCFLLLVAGTIAVNMSVDVYGLYRNTRGRHLVDYGDNRISKYLLSEHYVPENFDAILVGPSVSANWDTHGIHTFRTYNESLNGSNFYEQECLVRHAVASPGLKAAFIIVHPSMTASHEFDTVDLTDKLDWGALGSLSLLDAYRDWFGRYRHPENLISDDYGTDFFVDPTHLNAIAARLVRPGSDFPIDPLAMDAFHRILAECRQNQVRIVFIVPPTSPPIFEPKRRAFEDYFRLIEHEKRPKEEVIDLQADRYCDFFCKAANFSDGVHISRAGVPRIVQLLDHELAALKEKGLL